MGEQVSQMSIFVITTGGTIRALPYKDFVHTAEEDFLAVMPSDGKDFVKEALGKRADFNGRCISLEPRDSKLMDELYRLNLLRLVESVPENKIIITHGTDSI